MKIVWDEPNLRTSPNTMVSTSPISMTYSSNARLIAVARSKSGVVVFVVLGSEGVSVVSMRPANRKERKLLNG